MTGTLLATLLVSLVLRGTALGFPITTCGVDVPDKAVGTLMADLNCADPGTPAVRLGHRATLELNGHAIQGISSEPMQSHVVVTCLDRKCTIIGPGSVSGNDGVSSYGTCIGGPDDGTLTMTSDGQGEIVVQNCSNGLLGRTAKLQDVHAQANVVGISFYKGLQLRNVNASGNVIGVVGRRVNGIDVDANANAVYGILGNAFHGVAHLRDVTATGNGDAGVLAYGVAIKNGTVTGNGGYGQGIDVVSVKTPHVSDLTCGKSGKIGESYINTAPPLLPGSWGVCAAD